MFYRLHLIEAYGTGMKKIMKAYEGLAESPVIETTKNAFKIILPNVNAKHENKSAPDLSAGRRAGSSAGTGEPLSGEEEKVLEYAQIHGAVTRNDVIRLLDLSMSTAARVIKKLVNRGLLKQNGKARRTNYTIAG